MAGRCRVKSIIFLFIIEFCLPYIAEGKLCKDNLCRDEISFGKTIEENVPDSKDGLLIGLDENIHVVAKSDDGKFLHGVSQKDGRMGKISASKVSIIRTNVDDTNLIHVPNEEESESDRNDENLIDHQGKVDSDTNESATTDQEIISEEPPQAIDSMPPTAANEPGGSKPEMSQTNDAIKINDAITFNDEIKNNRTDLPRNDSTNDLGTINDKATQIDNKGNYQDAENKMGDDDNIKPVDTNTESETDDAYTIAMKSIKYLSDNIGSMMKTSREEYDSGTQKDKSEQIADPRTLFEDPKDYETKSNLSDGSASNDGDSSGKEKEQLESQDGNEDNIPVDKASAGKYPFNKFPLKPLSDPIPKLNVVVQSEQFAAMRRNMIRSYIASHFAGMEIDEETQEMIDDLVSSDLLSDLRDFSNGIYESLTAHTKLNIATESAVDRAKQDNIYKEASPSLPNEKHPENVDEIINDEDKKGQERLQREEDERRELEEMQAIQREANSREQEEERSREIEEANRKAKEEHLKKEEEAKGKEQNQNYQEMLQRVEDAEKGTERLTKDKEKNDEEQTRKEEESKQQEEARKVEDAKIRKEQEQKNEEECVKMEKELKQKELKERQEREKATKNEEEQQRKERDKKNEDEYLIKVEELKQKELKERNAEAARKEEQRLREEYVRKNEEERLRKADELKQKELKEKLDEEVATKEEERHRKEEELKEKELKEQERLRKEREIANELEHRRKADELKEKELNERYEKQELARKEEEHLRKEREKANEEERVRKVEELKEKELKERYKIQEAVKKEEERLRKEWEREKNEKQEITQRFEREEAARREEERLKREQQERKIEDERFKKQEKIRQREIEERQERERTMKEEEWLKKDQERKAKEEVLRKEELRKQEMKVVFEKEESDKKEKERSRENDEINQQNLKEMLQNKETIRTEIEEGLKTEQDMKQQQLKEKLEKEQAVRRHKELQERIFEVEKLEQAAEKEKDDSKRPSLDHERKADEQDARTKENEAIEILKEENRIQFRVSRREVRPIHQEIEKAKQTEGDRQETKHETKNERKGEQDQSLSEAEKFKQFEDDLKLKLEVVRQKKMQEFALVQEEDMRKQLKEFFQQQEQSKQEDMVRQKEADEKKRQKDIARMIEENQKKEEDFRKHEEEQRKPLEVYQSKQAEEMIMRQHEEMIRQKEEDEKQKRYMEGHRNNVQKLKQFNEQQKQLQSDRIHQTQETITKLPLPTNRPSISSFQNAMKKVIRGIQASPGENKNDIGFHDITNPGPNDDLKFSIEQESSVKLNNDKIYKKRDLTNSIKNSNNYQANESLDTEHEKLKYTLAFDQHNANNAEETSNAGNACIEMNIALNGHDLVPLDTTRRAVDWHMCQQLCMKTVDCRFWTQAADGRCWLKSSDAGRIELIGSLSGPKNCPTSTKPTGTDTNNILQRQRDLLRKKKEKENDLHATETIASPSIPSEHTSSANTHKHIDQLDIFLDLTQTSSISLDGNLTDRSQEPSSPSTINQSENQLEGLPTQSPVVNLISNEMDGPSNDTHISGENRKLMGKQVSKHEGTIGLYISSLTHSTNAWLFIGLEYFGSAMKAVTHTISIPIISAGGAFGKQERATGAAEWLANIPPVHYGIFYSLCIYNLAILLLVMFSPASGNEKRSTWSEHSEDDTKKVKLQLQATSTELEAYLKTDEDLHAKVEDYKENEDELNVRLEEISASCADWKAKAESFELQYSDSVKENTELVDAIAQFEGTIVQLEREKMDLKYKETKQNEDIVELREAKEQKEQHIFFIVKELDVKDGKLDEMDEEIKSLNQKIVRLQEKLELNEKKREDLFDEFESSQAKLNESMEVTSSRQEDIDKLNDEIEVLRNMIIWLEVKDEETSENGEISENGEPFQKVELEEQKENEAKTKEERLSHLLDVTKMRVKLSQTKSELDLVSDELETKRSKLEQFEANNLQLQSSLDELSYDCKKFKTLSEELKIQKETLAKFFHERETALQKSVAESQAQCLQLRTVLDKSGEAAKLNIDLEKRIADMELDFEKERSEFRSKLNDAENEKHNSYMKEKQAIRDKELILREKEILRKRLSEMSNSLTATSRNSPIASPSATPARAASDKGGKAGSVGSNKSNDGESGEGASSTPPPPIGPPHPSFGPPPPFMRAPFGVPYGPPQSGMSPYAGPYGPRPPYRPPPPGMMNGQQTMNMNSSMGPSSSKQSMSNPSSKQTNGVPLKVASAHGLVTPTLSRHTTPPVGTPISGAGNPLPRGMPVSNFNPLINSSMNPGGPPPMMMVPGMMGPRGPLMNPYGPPMYRPPPPNMMQRPPPPNLMHRPPPPVPLQRSPAKS